MTCDCGTPEMDLPIYAVFKPTHDAHGNFTGETTHMFHGCHTCGITFCDCGVNHHQPSEGSTTRV
jgi:hypothetical protein